MKIIEEFIEGKNKNPNLCEDKIYKGNRFISIIDGATSKSKKRFEGKSGGLCAAEIVFKSLELIENNMSLLTDPIQICDFIRKQFISFYNKHNINYIEEPTSRIVASSVIYDNSTKKIFFIGDCLAILKNNSKEILLENSKEIDDITSNTRSLYIASLLKRKEFSVESLRKEDLGRDYIEPLLKEQLRFQNKNIMYGYGCFDGTPIPKNFINIFNVKPNTNIILSSDGYPKLFSNLNDSEIYLKSVLSEDPLLYKIYKTTKGYMTDQNSFDDRSYISFFN